MGVVASLFARVTRSFHKAYTVLLWYFVCIVCGMFGNEKDSAQYLAHVCVFISQVHVVASLPCYSPKNVNMQRGSGVFDRSIKGLMKLNALGYGQAGSDLKLDLVYNPVGGFLPPQQVRKMHNRNSQDSEVFCSRWCMKSRD